ncbi:MAG TPA: glycosyltransferase family 1 protein [Chloroflexota bacterium]
MPRLEHIVVDLSLLGPGGQNGGAGLVAVSLVENLSLLRPDLRLTLLTASASHHELAHLESERVRRLCIVDDAEAPLSARGTHTRLKAMARHGLDWLSPGTRVRLKQAYHNLRRRRSQSQLLRRLAPDLVFCPFTSPRVHDSVPSVSIVYDLQHLTYPEFFDQDQWHYRQHHLRDACRRATRLVCISDFVRKTLVASFPEAAERAVSVPLGLLASPTAGGNGADSVLTRLGLTSRPFVLYPANFWPHKNHAALLEAMRSYRELNPRSELVLVCTGVPNALSSDLQRLADETMPADAVVFAGYVLHGELTALLANCRGLIFPSLYEGFGMPVLEAMAFGKPVLCSRVTNLPDLAGDAAYYFDPTQPEEIRTALAFLEEGGSPVAELVRRGRTRAAQFGTARDVACRYIEIFEAALADRHA